MKNDEKFSYRVIIVSRGDIEGVLAGLVSQAAYEPFPIILALERAPTEPRTLYLIETLRHLDCPIMLAFQPASLIGYVGRLRAWAMLTLKGQSDVSIFLDDDAVLVPSNALARLAETAATEHCWTTPIIRFAANFREAPIPYHNEIWELISEDDERIQEGIAYYGQGWKRVYEFGRDIPTSQLGGTCFAVPPELLANFEPGKLEQWGKVTGEDFYIGKLLGQGIVLSGIYAYHFGAFTYEEWGYTGVAVRLMLEDVEAFADYT